MSAPRYARLASRLFVRDAGTHSPSVDPADRERAIRAIGEAIAARNRARRRARWASGIAAAAACALVAVGVSHRIKSPIPTATGSGPAPVQMVARDVQGAASVLVSGSTSPLAEESPVAEGSRLLTPSGGRATLSFSTGTTVVLGESSDMAVVGDSSRQLLRLNTGSIDLHVAKLAPLQRFIVGTSDAEVEVRGTKFSVSIARPDSACGKGTTTRVSVTEGVVVVRHDGSEERITAGEKWPAECPPETATEPSVAASRASRPGAIEIMPSTLAEQNDLFAEGLAARRQSDTRGALAAFDRLIAKYPSSPLAESAQVESMRLLRITAPSRAPATARQYLISYPRGFARAEAEAIITESP